MNESFTPPDITVMEGEDLSGRYEVEVIVTTTPEKMGRELRFQTDNLQGAISRFRAQIGAWGDNPNAEIALHDLTSATTLATFNPAEITRVAQEVLNKAA